MRHGINRETSNIYCLKLSEIPLQAYIREHLREVILEYFSVKTDVANRAFLTKLGIHFL